MSPDNNTFHIPRTEPTTPPLATNAQPLQPGYIGQPNPQPLPTPNYPAQTPPTYPAAQPLPQPQGYEQPQPGQYSPPGQQPLYRQPVLQPMPQATVRDLPDQSNARYDFFMNETPRPAKALIPQTTHFTRIILIAVGIFVVLGILAVILSSQRSGSSPVTALIGIVDEQQEIIRVSDLGLAQAESSSLKSFSATTSTTVTSAQQELIAYLKRNGASVNTQTLALKKNAKVDQVLAAAQQASVYDATYKSTMQSLLTDYQSDLSQREKLATSIAQREIIGKDLAAAKLLLQMLNQ